jgi:hypothetical protein
VPTGQQTPISTLPLGLLGFLGIKSFGEYPQYLGGTILPTLDLLGLWSGAQATHANGIAVNAALGFNSVSLIVPQTEIWYVTMGHVVATVDAAEAIKITGELQPSVGAGVFITPTVDAAASAGVVPATINYPMWFGPGDELGVRVSTLTGAAVAINARVRRIVFPI